jgi:beta-glucanase (GH16 family)
VAPTTTTVPLTVQPDGVPGSWHLALDDEFSGTTLNTALWNTQYPWGSANNGDGSIETFQPANTAVNGQGQLVLTAKKSGSAWTSGQVNTFGKFSIEDGVYEIRAELPNAVGTWPAFWALPADGSWPPEIDVVEAYGSQPGIADMTYHWGDSSNPQQQDKESNLSTSYHVFDAEVTSSAITWYIDGVKQWSFTNTKDIAQLKPLYLVADLDIGGSGGKPGSGPYSESIDYIRAWTAA